MGPLADVVAAGGNKSDSWACCSHALAGWCGPAAAWSHDPDSFKMTSLIKYYLLLTHYTV